MPVDRIFKGWLLLGCWCLLPLGAAQAQPNPIDPEILKQLKLVQKDGQDLLQISLKAVLKIAQDRAPQLAVIANQVEAARRNQAANQGIEPVLWTTAAVQSRSVSPSTFLLTGASGAADYLSLTGSNQQVLSTGLSHKTKWGLKYGLTYQRASSLTQMASMANSGDAAGEWTDYDQAIYSDALVAEVSLPLLRGFGGVNLDGERRAEVSYRSSRLQGAASTRDLLGQIASIYWDLVGVHESIKALKHSLELARQFHQDNLVRFRLGAIDATEVKLSETQKALAERNLLSAQIERQQIEDQIRIILGLKDLVVAYEPTEIPQLKPVPGNLKELVERALATDPTVKLYQEKIELNRLDEIQAKDRLSSSLDLGLKYQINGFGKDPGTATSGLGDAGLVGYQVGLTWSVPLFDRRPNEKLAQVRLERDSLETQFVDAKDQLEANLGAILRRLELARQSIELAQVGAELNQELYQKERARFGLGNTTSYRVDQVRQDMLDSEISLAQAKINYEKTYLQLMLLTDQFEAHYEL